VNPKFCKWPVFTFYFLTVGDALLRSIGGQLTTLAGEGIDYSGKPPKVKNMGGVLATMHNHPLFVEKLKDTLVTIK